MRKERRTSLGVQVGLSQAFLGLLFKLTWLAAIMNDYSMVCKVRDQTKIFINEGIIGASSGG